VSIKKDTQLLGRIKKAQQKDPQLASLIYKLHRLNTMEKMGLDNYRKACAEYAQQYRDDNPEIMEDQYADARTSKHCVLLVYKKSAKKRKLCWELTDEHAENMFGDNCYYCGQIDLVKGKRIRDGISQDKFEYVEINGIDRKDNSKGYVNDNVCACCTMCNFIKGEIHINTYLKQIVHILSKFLLSDKIIKYPNVFPDRIAGSFNDFKQSAIKREKDFELTENQFYAIVIQDCYMCGKETAGFHVNGIDRYDNTIGYTINNCFSCCTTCNFLKNKFDFVEIIKKFYLTACNLFKNQFKYNEKIFNLIDPMVKMHVNVLNINKIGMINNLLKDEENNTAQMAKINDEKNIVAKNIATFNDSTDAIEKRKNALYKQISLYRKATNDEDKEKFKNAQIEMNALNNDPNYKISDYKKIAMTDAERQQKHRSIINEGKIKKIPKTGAERIKEYRERQKLNNNKDN
jgi:hypothetical protein